MDPALAITLSFLLGWGATPSSGQQPTQAPRDSVQRGDSTAAGQPRVFPVVVRGDTLFFVRESLGPFTAADRATALATRLAGLVRGGGIEGDSLRLVERSGQSDIVIGGSIIMTVTDADARAAGTTRLALATTLRGRMVEALGAQVASRGLRTLLLAALYAVLSTLVLLLLLRFLQRVFPRLHSLVDSWKGTRIRSLRVQKLELVSAERITHAVHAAVSLLRILITLLLAYAYLLLVFSFFPRTRRVANALAGYVVDPVAAVGRGFLGYLPDLFYIAVIIVVIRYLLKGIRLVFYGVEHGAINIRGFYPEWAEPTYKIVRFLVVVFAVIMIWPYLPNSDSIAFKGVAAFLGLLLSLGSASAVANVIGGTVMVYMRPFQVGDRVRIADTVGDVVEKNLLVTRVRTIKNVDVTIPNALVLGSHITNYSSAAKAHGLILHTSVTIGYDVPWPSVHAALIAAARTTPDLLTEPPPYVLQTALDDFYVKYEINAFTDRPGRMARIYSDLHQSIQDRFREAGIEIMSPHYAALRDGNAAAIPGRTEKGVGADRGFRVSLREGVAAGAGEAFAQEPAEGEGAAGAEGPGKAESVTGESGGGGGSRVPSRPSA